MARVPAAAPALLPVKDVVFPLLYGLGRQQARDLAAPRVLVIPLTHCVEHVTLDLDVLIAESRVVEGAEDVVYDLVGGDVGVLPREQHAPRSVSKRFTSERHSMTLTERRIGGS